MIKILFLSFLVISTLAVAIPQRFTKHLHQVSMQDCDRVLAKIVTVESKDRDLKSHLDEVPQCVTFFTERLTRESFKDKDYRRACSPLLQDFCQQHRYLSLPTLTENYKTNKLKVAGSMGLGYMFGKTTSRTVKKYLHRLKKTEESKAKSQEAECFERLKSNQEIAKICEEKAPQDCIEGWRLKDKRCIVEADVCNEAIMPKLVCECIPDRSKLAAPPEWEYKIDGDNVECIDKREKDCDELNGVNTKPYKVAGKSDTGYFSGKIENVNSELHIIKWKYDSADTSRGIKGCYVNLCENNYMVDSWELGCKKTTPNPNNPNPPNPPNPPLQSCAGYETKNGKGENISDGHVFGITVADCRTVCEATYASKHTTASNGGNTGECKPVANSCDLHKHKFAGQAGTNIIGWEYKANTECSALCKNGWKYNSAETQDLNNICKKDSVNNKYLACYGKKGKIPFLKKELELGKKYICSHFVPGAFAGSSAPLPNEAKECYVGNNKVFKEKSIFKINSKPVASCDASIFNQTTKSNYSDIIEAIKSQKKDDVLFFINTNNYKTEDALHYLAQFMPTHGDIASLLISKGLSVNSKNNTGKTPICYAVESNSARRDASWAKYVGDILVEKGADLNINCGSGETPLFLACQGPQEKILDLLLKQNLTTLNSKTSLVFSPVRLGFENT